MTERSIVEAAARLRREREPYLVATVVCANGSAYRRPGARMILTRFRWVAGSINGGCLEGDISRTGWSLTRDGEPVVVTYDSRAETDDEIRSAFGLGCDGVVDVMLERAGAAGRIDALEFAERCLRAQRRGAVATIYRSDAADVRAGSRLALVDGAALEGEARPLDDRLRAQLLEDLRAAIASGVSANRTYATAHGTVDALIEVVRPPPQLFLFGTAHDAVPVAQLAKSVGWDVAVCAPDPKASTRDRFAGVELVSGDVARRIADSDRAIAIVMNHDLERDRASLGLLLATDVEYIGVLGPRARTQRLLAELGAPADDARVHAPVGLELGAETPAQVAVAIVAEAMAALAHTGAASLRDRSGPIHDPFTPSVAA